MSEKNKNLSESSINWKIDGSLYKVGIVVSEWNHEITDALFQACFTTLCQNQVKQEHITAIKVPGAFELPCAAKLLATSTYFDAIICIGCVIKGDTKHDEYIGHAVAQGITNLSIELAMPIIFGVLTPNTYEQAKERAGGIHGNKGDEAAVTALKMIQLRKRIEGV